MNNIINNGRSILDMDPQELSSQQTEETATETDSLSVVSLLSAQERTMLPRKVQHALRKLRLAKKVLMDPSIRDEIESTLGEGSFEAISQEMVGSLPSSPADEDDDVIMQNSKADSTEPLLQKASEVAQPQTFRPMELTSDDPPEPEPSTNPGVTQTFQEECPNQQEIRAQGPLPAGQPTL